MRGNVCIDTYVTFGSHSRMEKSRAEIQKAYRERKKAKDQSFLEKERVQKSQYYVPAAV